MEERICLGHKQREERKFKIQKLTKSPIQSLDETQRVLIKKGPLTEETSLRELEENYARKPEWKVIEALCHRD